MKKTGTIFTLNPHKEHIRIVHAFENEWKFEYPRLKTSVHEALYAALDLLQSGDLKKAEAAFTTLIEEYPEFIDAHHHLAIILCATSRGRKAREIWVNAVNLGLSAFPAEFKTGVHTLEWGIVDNRPFLRAYHSYGLQLLDAGETEEALALFEHILMLNPNDNQGARVLAIDCYFELGRPADVLAILKNFPGDGLAESIYGIPLALFQLDRLPEARRALAKAIGSLPLVAAELVKKTHRNPGEMHTVRGGRAEAYQYWMRYHDYWVETEGALQFVAEALRSGAAS
jgi:tetratricopeptide (TPR) repeat protein